MQLFLCLHVMRKFSERLSSLQEPSWAEIYELEDRLFPENEKCDRLYFSDAFLCYSKHLGSSDKEYPKNMRVMRGLALAMAWYHAMAQAVSKSDVDRCSKLHIMGLTITVRCYKLEGSALLLKSMQNSEKSKIPQNTDSFYQFSAKLTALVEQESHQNLKQADLLGKLVSYGIKFNGVAINRTMMQGAMTLKTMVDPQIESVLLALQREFGRSLWSGHTSKLSRVAQLANKQVSVWNLADASGSNKHARDLMLFAMEACLIALRCEQCDLAFFNLDTIDKPGGGWAQGTFVKAYLIRKIIDMAKVSASKNNNAESTDTLTVLQSIGSPLAYHNKIPFGNDTLGDAWKTCR